MYSRPSLSLLVSRSIPFIFLAATILCMCAPSSAGEPAGPKRGAITVHTVDDTVVKPSTAQSEPRPAEAPVIAKAETVALEANGQGKLIIKMSKPTYLIGELLELTIFSDRDCFVRVVQFGSDKSTTQLFPNAFAKDNFLRGGDTLRLPNGNYRYRTNPPPGEEKIVVFVSGGQFTDNTTLLAGASRGVPFPALSRAGVVTTRGQITIEAVGEDKKPAEVIGASVTYQLED
jgi:hypothetical protein